MSIWRHLVAILMWLVRWELGKVACSFKVLKLNYDS